MDRDLSHGRQGLSINIIDSVKSTTNYGQGLKPWHGQGLKPHAVDWLKNIIHYGQGPKLWYGQGLKPHIVGGMKTIEHICTEMISSLSMDYYPLSIVSFSGRCSSLPIHCTDWELNMSHGLNACP